MSLKVLPETLKGHYCVIHNPEFYHSEIPLYTFVCSLEKGKETFCILDLLLLRCFSVRNTYMEIKVHYLNEDT